MAINTIKNTGIVASGLVPIRCNDQNIQIPTVWTRHVAYDLQPQLVAIMIIAGVEVAPAHVAAY